MLRQCFVLAILTFLLHHVTAAGDVCPPLPVNHFQWLKPDSSLVTSYASNDDEESCFCGTTRINKWQPLPASSSCQFCENSAALVCQGSEVYDVPNPAKLPSKKLSLYKLSGVGLVSLPPKCFSGLSIKKLVIENSNLSHLTLETFSGVKSIETFYMKNHILDNVLRADVLFQNIKDLKSLSLEDSGLKVLTAAASANMHNLTYFSLAGNPLYIMNVIFLQNSSLSFFDLRNTTFKMKKMDIKDTGLSKLPSSLNTIDLSRATISTGVIEKIMEQLKRKNITTLNLSYLHSQFISLWVLRHIKNSLQYLSLKGTNLYPIFSKLERKIKLPKFVNMKELNLENCNISVIGSGRIFKAFPNLTVLSLSENNFFSLDLTLFLYLPKLLLMDLSDNVIMDIVPKEKIENLNVQGVNLSNTSIFLDEDESAIFFGTLKRVQMLSLCKIEMSYKAVNALQTLNNLKYLDLSAMFSSSDLEPIMLNDLLSSNNTTLTELHFTRNNFKLTSDYHSFFSQLNSLEILDISNNSISEISSELFGPSLKTLNVSQNLIITWYFSTLKNESQLQFLDVSNNQITYISKAMIGDFYKLDSLSLYGNPLICNNKIVALVCSNIKNNTPSLYYEKGGKTNESKTISKSTENTKNNSQTLILVEWQRYRCYDLLFNGFRQFSQERDCNEYYEEVSSTLKPENPNTETITQYDKETTIPTQQPAQKLIWNWKWAYFVLCPIVAVSVLGSIIYLKWWDIRCFIHRYMSLRKVDLLRKSGNLLVKPEVYYDVFVSYSDVDRAWVLDHLVPNMEGIGAVSLCFHERDFQVGLTILENIIDCMDRSHALLLVVSRAFIYSKWCQFEMHLAQYRLVETFRNQLVLVLLEDIPRKMRPQTLHHLMMTKTYLMWPQQPCKDNAHELFWRRLKRALRPNPNYTPPT